MANIQNLKVLTPNEARELGRIGGIMSGQSRREYKKIQKIASVISSMPARDMMPVHTLNNGSDISKFYGLDNPSVAEAVVAKIASSALKGNVPAAKLFLELAGGLPKIQSINIVSCQTTKDAMQVVYGHAKQEVVDT